jgi:hypothetical protein
MPNLDAWRRGFWLLDTARLDMNAENGKWKPAARVVYRAYGDGSGGVLLDLNSSLYFEVNRVGALIWQLIGDGLSTSEIVDRLHAETDATPNEVIDDVNGFLEALASRTLIFLA